MPITKTTGYLASDGIVYASIDKAQLVELGAVFKSADHPDQYTATWTVEEIADQILSQRDAILSILTTGPTSRPSARKRAGTTSPKRAAKRATEAAKSLNDPDKPWNQSEAGKTGLAARVTEAQATAGFKAMRQAATPEEKAHVEDVTGMPYTAAADHAA